MLNEMSMVVDEGKSCVSPCYYRPERGDARKCQIKRVMLNMNGEFTKCQHPSIRRAAWFLLSFTFVAACDGYVQPRIVRPKISTIFHQKTRDSDDADGFFHLDRRRILESLVLAPVILLPFGGARALESPDFNCLVDLPSVPDDCVRIYLCRHGQTENNRLRKVQGARVDPPINENGLSQAEGLGKALARANPRPKVFFNSKLERARMTAETAAHEIDPKLKTRDVEALGEVDFGPVAEGQPVALAKAGMQATYAAWAIGQIDYRPNGGGDSGRDVLVRAADALKFLAQEAKNSSNGCVAAVSHSVYLRILLGLVLDQSLIEMADRKIVNGGVTVLDVKRDGQFRRLEPKPKLLGGALSTVPSDFRLDVPVCQVVRINEMRHLPDV
jgi:broad specificity phosphatase PhoE